MANLERYPLRPRHVLWTPDRLSRVLRRRAGRSSAILWQTGLRSEMVGMSDMKQRP